MLMVPVAAFATTRTPIGTVSSNCVRPPPPERTSSETRRGEYDVEMAARCERAQKAMGAAVTIVGRQHQIARPQELQYQRDGRHAGAGNDRALPSLEIGERARKVVARRIAGARVVVPTLLPETVERKRRAEMNRRNNRTVMQIFGDSGADGTRGGFARSRILTFRDSAHEIAPASS